MNIDLAELRHVMGGHVHRPTIAKEHDIRNAMLAQEPVDEQGPSPAGAAVICRVSRPVGTIATVQIDPEDPALKIAKPFGQTPEEAAGRTLQKQKIPVRYGLVLHLVPTSCANARLAHPTNRRD
ncbi:hypothetical protein [Sphingobium sp. SYK-6]|uniref:hypothetical protein n=1 Tax=Sphingobium sp. (strain NBRC 103272 / SYK-6) TaxID=627192 RepID=UPI001E5DA314|nr:hypothetical protein [Sphingobium sp. SYK-6]